MLVHICCSVDSHYFLQVLQKAYPNKKISAFFYNPNIHPKEEYELRLFDVEKSCEMLGVDLIVGDYDFMSWFDSVAGLEDCEEKGERCSVCFDERLLKTAILARNLGKDSITTTLLASPMKSQDILFSQGDEIAKKYGLEFVKIDVRSDGGTQRQSKLAKDSNLYRQNYCGCQYALTKQRNNSNKVAFELFNDIGGQILPGSAKYSIDVFREFHKLKAKNIPCLLQKNSINAYRILAGNVAKIESGEILPSYIFTHSRKVKNLKTRNISWEKVSFEGKNIMLGFCDNAMFIDIESINLALNKSYKNVLSMLYNPPLYIDELRFRMKILGLESVKPFIVIDSNLDSTLDSRIYDNIKINIDAVFQNIDVFELIKLDL